MLEELHRRGLQSRVNDKVDEGLIQKGGRTIGHSKRGDGTSTRNKEEILETLLDAFFP